MRVIRVPIWAGILFVLSGCHFSPESKAEENIKKYMLENINDPKGYESVRFGELANDSTMISEAKEYIVYEDSISLVQSQLVDLKHKYLVDEISYRDYLIRSIACNQMAIDILARKDKWMRGYVFKPCGFNMMHIYRRKNSNGATVLDSMCFRLDSSYNIKPQKYYSFINADR